MSNSNIDDLIQSIFIEGQLYERMTAKGMNPKYIFTGAEAKQAIQQELLKPRISEHEHIRWCSDESKFIEYQANRIADLQAKLKDTTRKSE